MQTSSNRNAALAWLLAPVKVPTWFNYLTYAVGILIAYKLIVRGDVLWVIGVIVTTFAVTFALKAVSERRRAKSSDQAASRSRPPGTAPRLWVGILVVADLAGIFLVVQTLLAILY